MIGFGRTPPAARTASTSTTRVRPCCAPDAAAMTDHLELEARIGGYEAAGRPRTRLPPPTTRSPSWSARAPREIALFDNSTHAWNAAFYSVAPRAQATGSSPAGTSTGATCWPTSRWPSGPGPRSSWSRTTRTGQIDVDALRELVDERTRLIGLTWVPTSGGLINPAAEVGRIARAAGVTLPARRHAVVGQLPIDVECDRLRHAHRYRPQVPAWPARHRVPLRRRTRPGTARPARRRDPLRDLGRRRRSPGPRAPGGSRPGRTATSTCSASGPRCARRWTSASTRSQRAASRARVTGCADGLDGLDGVTTHDLGRDRCAIVTASVRNRPTDEVAAALSAAGVNVSTTVAEHSQLDTENRGVHPLVRLSAALLQHRGRDRPRRRRGRPRVIVASFGPTAQSNGIRRSTGMWRSVLSW